jgi:hypothetical protein
MLGEFADDPYGFVMAVYPWGEKGTPLENYDSPDDWQIEILETLGEEIRKRKFDGHNAVEPIRMAVSSGHGIGKSALTAWLIHFIMSTRPNAKGVVTSGKYEQLKDKTWSELKKWQKLAINGHWFDYCGSSGNLSYRRIGSKEEWKCVGFAAKKEQSDAFAGLHNANSTPFYIFDEASAVPDEIYEVAEGGLTDGEPMIFMFGNPVRNVGAFISAIKGKTKRWITRCIDSRKARMTNKTVIQQWIDDYGIDSDFVKVRVRGMPPNAASNQLIGDACVTKARDARLHPDEFQFMTLVIGVDVARFGTDESVICVRQGRKVLRMRTFVGLDNIQLALRVAETYRAYDRVDGLLVDEVGTGSGVVDYLRNVGYPVIGVISGEKADDPKKFFNRRAEMWWKMKEWLEAGQVEIPDDSTLHDQIVAQEYFYTVKEQVQLVAKKDMDVSPDRADALAFTFSHVIHHNQTPGSFEPD